MKISFNLNKFQKQAFYEGARGYSLRNSRCWPNCLKEKMNGKNKSQHEAYEGCLGEYNDWDTGKWLSTYSGTRPDSGNERDDLVTPGAKDLKVHKK